jgi:ribonuclease HII
MIAGVDEAGRGPLAGPVVAAAVVLPGPNVIRGIGDSKTLSPEARERLAVEIRARALAYGVGWADPAEIDALNILEATFLAMRRAILALSVIPAEILVDGNRLPRLTGLGAQIAVRAIVRGDASVECIGAASILAKTARDAYMEQVHTIYPLYGFSDHKGYPTPAHRHLLMQHGACPLHRRSFTPVGEVLSLQSAP